jgi:hypothetical protein
VATFSYRRSDLGPCLRPWLWPPPELPHAVRGDSAVELGIERRIPACYVMGTS